jgi:hypothetical protein
MKETVAQMAPSHVNSREPARLGQVLVETTPRTRRAVCGGTPYVLHPTESVRLTAGGFASGATATIAIDLKAGRTISLGSASASDADVVSAVVLLPSYLPGEGALIRISGWGVDGRALVAVAAVQLSSVVCT